MYNIVVDQIRARGRRPRELRLHDAGERSDPQPADLHDSVEPWPTLRTALDSLTVQQRTVIALRYLDDCSEAETAKLLGISVGTVKSTATRSIAHLRAFPGLADLFTTTDFNIAESML
jgi:RNA polymerase sigma factor (sigma-70 family)